MAQLLELSCYLVFAGLFFSYFFGIRIALFLCFSILIFLFSTRKEATLITLSLVSWYFLDKLALPIDKLAQSLQVPFSGFILRACAFCSVIFLGALCFRIKKNIAYSLGFFLVFSFLYLAFRDGYPVTVFAQFSYFIGNTLSFFLFPVLLVLNISSKTLTNSERIKQMSLMLPIWNIGRTRAQSVIIFFEDQKNYFLSLDPEKILKTQRSAILLMIYIIIIEGAVQFFDKFIFSNKLQFSFPLSGSLKDFENIAIYDLNKDFRKLMAAPESAISTWISALFTFVCMYSKVFVALGKQVAIGRMMGISLKNSFDRPWRAKGVAQFYGRMLYYYNQILMKVFFPLSSNFFSWVKNRRLRTYLALHGSIFLGGIIYHFLRDFEIIFRKNFATTAIEYLRSVPYYICIATIVTVSTILKYRNIYLIPEKTPVVLRVSIYLTIWSLVYTLYSGFFRARLSLEEYSHFLMALVGYDR